MLLFRGTRLEVRIAWTVTLCMLGVGFMGDVFVFQFPFSALIFDWREDKDGEESE